ncbi:MAG TPA: ROK family transcriptional regulator [Mycobacteriales bacterium]|nr:ROK family transcriptional regulator [Mycobacteriales bacterium]
MSLSPSQDRIVRQLRIAGPLSRSALVDGTGLARATVVTAVAALIDSGLVEERARRADDRRPPSLGRPAGVIALSRAAGLVAAVDLGKRHVRVAVADMSHEILAERTQPTEPDLPAWQGIAHASQLLDATLAEAHATRADVLGVGVGVPGPLDEKTGQFGSSTILPGWVGVNAQSAFAEELGLPVAVGNDGNLGALAEAAWGVAAGVSEFAYIKWATGIGCGLFARGGLVRGASGLAGEIGHVTVAGNDAFCRCGNRGCLDTVAGTQALLDAIAPALGDITVDELLTRAADGDLVCRRALADAAAHVGAVLAPLINLTNPQLIVIGGPVARVADVVLPHLEAAIGRACVPAAAADVTLVASGLGDRAELLGALALVLRDAQLAVRGSRTVA